jgi:ATP-dependent Zn protease
LGVTWSLSEDTVGRTKEELLSHIEMALGGYVAEEVFYGKERVTTGASNDLQKVTSIANAMVKQYGMSNMGTINMSDNEVSSTTQYNIDKEVKIIVDTCYNNVKEIINKRKYEIEKVADILVEYETISGNEFLDILNGKTIREKTELISYS